MVRFLSKLLVSLWVFACAPIEDRAATAQESLASPNERDEVEITLEGEGPLRPLPFALVLPREMPSDAREIVEVLYEAIPQHHLDLLASYYGHIPADSPAQQPTFEELYIREILNEAFDHWGYTRDGSVLAHQISCIGREFVEQVGLQLGMMHIYSGRYGIIRFHSETTRAYSRAEMISRRLFDVCGEEISSGLR